MKKTVLIIIAIIAGFAVNAQSKNEYNQALGIKILDGGGITYKKFVTTNNAIEGIAFFWKQGMRVTGLYEFHKDIPNANGLQYYYGPGAHLGFYNKENGNGDFMGIDGVLGLDYKFEGIPVNISLDWQPAIEFASDHNFYAGWGGLALRYTF